MTNEKDVSRRSVLKGAAVAGAGVAGGAALLAGCGSSKNTDPVKFTVRGTAKSGVDIATAVNAAYTKKTGVKVTQQAVESDPFQNGISQYLQGTPDDVFGWMAGWRTNFYASQKLFHDVSANIKNLGDQLTAPIIQGATNPSDSKQYIIPTTYYPWGLHYRKSTMQAVGQDPENIATWDDLMKVMTATQKKGLVAYPMGNKGGWEAMGTFDVINARVNGYQYHIDLLNGKAKWTDAKTLETFKYMAMLIPFMNPNKNDIEWDGMRDILLQKKAGVMMMGSWFANDFLAKSKED
jgi:multiple sugar transport system substrate-binding protein